MGKIGRPPRNDGYKCLSVTVSKRYADLMTDDATQNEMPISSVFAKALKRYFHDSADNKLNLDAYKLELIRTIIAR